MNFDNILPRPQDLGQAAPQPGRGALGHTRLSQYELRQGIPHILVNYQVVCIDPFNNPRRDPGTDAYR